MSGPVGDRVLQDGVHTVGPDEDQRLVELWEASVRATHHFLAESDIQFFRPLIRDGLRGLSHLLCVRAASGQMVGFLGIEKDKMEALFVHPAWHRAGIGRRLAEHAMGRLGVKLVDVNEQNEPAVAFYKHLGFRVESRSPLDSTGKPFPLLHMRIDNRSGPPS